LIALSSISDVHCIKSSGQEGFMFEIKSGSGQVKTQHLCTTDDERQKWVYALMKTKKEPNAMPELESSEEAGKDKPEKASKQSKQKSSKVKEESQGQPLNDTKEKTEPKKTKKSEDRPKKKEESDSISKKDKKDTKEGVKSPRKEDKKNDKEKAKQPSDGTPPILKLTTPIKQEL